MYYIPTMGYLARKTLSTNWYMLQHGWILENITLSEKSQSQKDTQCMIHLYAMFRISKTIVTESRLVAARGRWSGGWGLISNRYRVSSCSVRNVLKLGNGDWLHNCGNILKTTKLYTLKGWILWYVNYILISL